MQTHPGARTWLKLSALASLLAALLAIGAEPIPPERLGTMIEALTRLSPEQVNGNPKLREALGRVLEATRGTPQFLRLAQQFQLTDQNAGLLEIAIKNPADESGVAAIRLILASQDVALLQNALNGTNAVAAQKTVEALGNTGDKKILPLLQPLVQETKRDPALRKQVVRSLAQIQEGAAGLLKLAREDALPADLKLVASMELNQVRWPALKAEAAQVLPLPQGRNAEPLPPVAELVKRPGDAAKGAAVFRRPEVGCINCHKVNNEGVDFGPALSEIGTKLGKDAIYEAILDPSAGISFGFEAWQVEFKSGDEAYGLIVSETDDEIAMKDAKAILTRYKKSDVKSRVQSKLSIMPAGLQLTMSTEDLVDLVEYLASLKKK